MKTAGIAGTMLTLCILSGCCITIGCWDGAREKSERTADLDHPMTPDMMFATETVNGSITVRGEQTDQCRIHAVITGRAQTIEEAERIADETKLEWKENGNTLTLFIQKPAFEKRNSLSVSLEITLPTRTALALKSTNGKITVSEIEKDVTANTTNGKVELHNIGGSAEAGSTNGTIQADQVTGNLNGRTTNGKIDAGGLRGNLDASTTNGSVDIRYEPSAPADRSIRIHTTNGSASVMLPADFAGKAEAETTNGKIYTDRPVTVTGRIDKHLSGTIGQGTGSLSIKTTNGSVHIR